jgi:hypothetical protein
VNFPHIPAEADTIRKISNWLDLAVLPEDLTQALPRYQEAAMREMDRHGPDHQDYRRWATVMWVLHSRILFELTAVSQDFDRLL